MKLKRFLGFWFCCGGLWQIAENIMGGGGGWGSELVTLCLLVWLVGDRLSQGK